MLELLTDGDVTARKRHKCVWCGEHIEIGEKHRQQSGIFEGEPFRMKYHAECHKAMLELHKIDRFAVEDGFMEGSFRRGTAEEA